VAGLHADFSSSPCQKAKGRERCPASFLDIAAGNSVDLPNFNTGRSSGTTVRMDPRHAAALGLVGWYLMVPPVASDGEVDAYAPLSKWWKFQTDDSADECRTFLLEMRTPPVTEAEWEGSRRAALELKHTPTLNPEELQKRLLESLCIEENDPRLKGK
jgi:hypothetical protein